MKTIFSERTVQQRDSSRGTEMNAGDSSTHPGEPNMKPPVPEQYVRL